MAENEVIVKQGVRILTPYEYKAIRNELNPKHRLIFDGMLFTAMRTQEFWRFLKHPEWYKERRKVIDLPKGSLLKEKAKQKERTILLSHLGVRAVEDLISNRIKPMTRQSWREILIRAAKKAGLSLEGICPKMTRKTYISWLVASYPSLGILIAISSGHKVETMMQHYLAIGFTKQDLDEIRIYTMGWGENIREQLLSI